MGPVIGITFTNFQGWPFPRFFKVMKYQHLFTSGLFALIISTGWGAKVPMSDERRAEEAEHIVSGEVVALASKFHQSKAEREPSLGMTNYTLTVLVDSVTKGKGIAPQTKIEVKAWRRSTKIPSLQGQDWMPKEGDRITLYLEVGEGKTYEPLLPNGIEVFKEPVDLHKLEKKNAERLEVGFGMMGFRDTLILYFFAEQRAVLVLSIGNKDESFPVDGRVYYFDTDTSEEDLKKWINNSYSDALHADAPQPVSKTKLPEGVCKVSQSKKGDLKKSGPRSTSYQEYEVTVQLKEHVLGKELTLAPMTDTAKVRVKVK
ncbi:MAG: hypothetical protein ACJAVK_002279 [Akkermansiaceae bacterium]|jgi:hypothetical protein